MDLEIMKDLIKKNIVDFSELVLNNYYKLGLNETDAVIIIKLNYLLGANKTYISPKELSESLSVSAQTTSKRLNSLIERGFIKLKLIKTKNGKQTESFNLDFLIERILKSDYEEKEVDKIEKNKTLEGRLVKLFEEEFNKPLSVLDIQTITKWLNEDKYTYEQIEDSLFEALRSRKLNIKYVDGILLKQDKSTQPKKYKKTTNIKDLKKIWE
ncbi:MAG: DNA replication protein DnaD [Candidatus Izimaplasma bacterium HR2]|nr:MAG: DNA replication protein DnaD [Candidatus Izimaplasma bacterium HR2]